MGKIFIGGSSEALPKAKAVERILRGIGIEPILWTASFKISDITFVAIENLVKQIIGAVLLATPDDESTIRGVPVKVPRSNVIFEFGYIVARIARHRVALCRYDGVELPSDFAGLTHVPMGAYDKSEKLNPAAVARIKSWARALQGIQPGIPTLALMHGYSGIWRGDTTYQLWRGIKIKKPNYVEATTKMVLQMPSTGVGGRGCVYGKLQVQTRHCYAEFNIADEIQEAHVRSDGSLRVRTVSQSRQRTVIEGKPPQRDGFEPVLRGPREFEMLLQCSDEPNVMTGEFLTKRNLIPYSRARTFYTRSDLSD